MAPNSKGRTLSNEYHRADMDMLDKQLRLRNSLPQVNQLGPSLPYSSNQNKRTGILKKTGSDPYTTRRLHNQMNYTLPPNTELRTTTEDLNHWEREQGTRELDSEDSDHQEEEENDRTDALESESFISAHENLSNIDHEDDDTSNQTEKLQTAEDEREASLQRSSREGNSSHYQQQYQSQYQPQQQASESLSDDNHVHCEAESNSKEDEEVADTLPISEMPSLRTGRGIKPKSAFMVFLDEFREKYSSRFAGLNDKEIVDIGVEVWRDMSKEKRVEFQLRASHLERQMEELGRCQRRSGRPRTAYQIFMKDYLDKEYERRKHLKTSRLTRLDVFHRGVRKWKRMSKIEKAIYEDRSIYANYVQDPSIWGLSTQESGENNSNNNPSTSQGRQTTSYNSSDKKRMRTC